MCAAAGFLPRIAYATDDYVAVQALVAAGLGVTTLPGLALAASRNPGVTADALPDSARHVLAATYGEPPDPPPTAALLKVLDDAASSTAGRLAAIRSSCGPTPPAQTRRGADGDICGSLSYSK